MGGEQTPLPERTRLPPLSARNPTGCDNRSCTPLGCDPGAAKELVYCNQFQSSGGFVERLHELRERYGFTLDSVCAVAPVVRERVGVFDRSIHRRSEKAAGRNGNRGEHYRHELARRHGQVQIRPARPARPKTDSLPGPLRQDRDSRFHPAHKGKPRPEPRAMSVGDRVAIGAIDGLYGAIVEALSRYLVNSHVTQDTET
jgi:hypothetical protein